MVVGRNIIQTYGKNALFQRFFFINSAIDQKYLKLGVVIYWHYLKTFCCHICLEEFDFWPIFHKESMRLCDRSAVYVSKMCK